MVCDRGVRTNIWSGELSSTRVKDRQGKHLDFYETPDKVVRGLIDSNFFDSGVETVLEPSAGRGAIVKSVQNKFPSVRVSAVEIQTEFMPDLAATGCDFIIGDFLEQSPTPTYDRIVANPPFSQAEAFIRHAYRFLKSSGRMAFLLRLPFIASVKRYELFKEIKPTEILVLSQRPKFGGSNIDSCDYAWIVWDRDPVLNVTLTWWIPPHSEK